MKQLVIKYRNGYVVIPLKSIEDLKAFLEIIREKNYLTIELSYKEQNEA